MNILHIAPIGHHSEGIGTVLQNLYPAQIKLGHDVRIITIYKNKIYQGWPLESITNKKDFELYLSKWSPDIVILHSHFQVEYYQFTKILVLKKIPYCVQLHGALSRSNYSNHHIKKVIAGILLFNSILKKANSIIYLNKAEYNNSIVPRINPNYIIIPNGCDQPFSLLINRPVNNPVDIVFIGRIRIIHKGLDVLVQVIRKLYEDGFKNVHFSFYGNEDDLDVEYLKKELANIPNAEYYGSAYGEKKDRILHRADIFLLTSRYEGMPMGVLEAWSYGVPCILTNGTNMTGDDVNKDAFWAAEFDFDSIYNTIVLAVKQYKDNPTKFRMAAREESHKYDWSVISKNTIDAYKQILSSVIE